LSKVKLGENYPRAADVKVTGSKVKVTS